MRDLINKKTAKKAGIGVLGAIAVYFGFGAGEEAKAQQAVGTGNECLRLETTAKREARGVSPNLAKALHDVQTQRLELNSSAAILYKCSVVRPKTTSGVDLNTSYDVVTLSGTKNSKVEVQLQGSTRRPDHMLKYHYTTPEYANIWNAVGAGNKRNGGKTLSNAQIHHGMKANIEYLSSKKNIPMTYDASNSIILREKSRKWVRISRGKKLVIETTTSDNGGRIVDILYKKSAVPKGMDNSRRSQSIRYNGEEYVHLTWEDEAIVPYALVTPFPKTQTPRTSPRPQTRPNPRPDPRNGGSDGGTGGITPPRPDPRNGGSDGGTGGITPPRPDPRRGGDTNPPHRAPPRRTPPRRTPPRDDNGSSTRPPARRTPRPDDGRKVPPNWPPGPTSNPTPKPTDENLRFELGLGVGMLSDEAVQYMPIGIVEMGYEVVKDKMTLGLYGTFGGMPEVKGAWQNTETIAPNEQDPYQRYGDLAERSRFKRLRASVGAYVKAQVNKYLRVKLGAGAVNYRTQTATDKNLQIRYPDGTPDGVADRENGSYSGAKTGWTGEGSAGVCIGNERGEACLEGRISGSAPDSTRKVEGGGSLTGTVRF